MGLLRSNTAYHDTNSEGHMTIEEINYQLNELRQKWQTNKQKRPIYELQARALNCALDIYYKAHPQQKLTETPVLATIDGK